MSQGKLSPDIRKHFFIEEVVKHCNRFLREVVHAPGLSVFKRHLDNTVNTVYLAVRPELLRQVGWMITVGPRQLKYCTLFYSCKLTAWGHDHFPRELVPVLDPTFEILSNIHHSMIQQRTFY